MERQNVDEKPNKKKEGKKATQTVQQKGLKLEQDGRERVRARPLFVRPPGMPVFVLQHGKTDVSVMEHVSVPKCAACGDFWRLQRVLARESHDAVDVVPRKWPFFCGLLPSEQEKKGQERRDKPDWPLTLMCHSKMLSSIGTANTPTSFFARSSRKS